MPAVPARDLVADRLARTYRDAWRRADAELQRIVDDPLTFRRQARLREIEAQIGVLADELDASARAWVQRELPDVYAFGASSMATAITGAHAGQALNFAATLLGSGSSTFAWTLPHREALAEVAGQTYDYLLRSTKLMRRTTKELVRAVVHDEVLQKLTSGETALQAGKRIARRLLADHQVAGVVYRNGARVSIEHYAEMVARTQTALAYNRGALVQCREDGIGWVEVFDGENCGWTSHDDADHADGSVRTIDEAATFSIAHPRCLRSFGPRPDLGTAPGTPVAGPEPATAPAPGNTHAATVAARAALVRHPAVTR